ncbi:MAG: hypothetical protein RIA63_12960, partial [Cyclobacteriaceae bacterium]
MEKDQFLFLLTNSASLNEEETTELGLLQDEFPYSQAIHNLLARGSQLNNLPSQKESLNKAAVYATDRSVLKALVTAPRVERKAERAPAPPASKSEESVARVTIQKEKIQEPEKMAPAPAQPGKEVQPQQKPKEPTRVATVPESKEAFQPSKLSGDDLLNELVEDLKKLKRLKHDFEVRIEQFDPTSSVPETKKEAEAKPKEKKPVKPPGGIIAEIKSTKKKIKPSDPKQKEQIEIIDKFIKSKPSIGKNNPNSAPADATDLAENSSVFSDNIVSETLVEILIKQGKKEKAVEVLKKLIWKFPQ